MQPDTTPSGKSFKPLLFLTLTLIFVGISTALAYLGSEMGVFRGILVLVTGFSAGVGVWGLYRSTRWDLKTYQSIFDRVAEGDLSVSAEEDLPGSRGIVGHSFNRMMQTIRNLSYYDAVTGLPNRAYFDSALKRLLSQDSTRHQKAAVAVVSLDKFKNVNDAHGSSAGDRVLKEMGRRIQTAAGDQCFVARGASAEYMVFVGNLGSRRQAVGLMNRILMDISRPFAIQNETVFLNASAGLSFYPQDAQEPEELLIGASIAKSSAKKAGGNTLKLYNESMRQSLSSQMHVEALLHRALEKKELSLMFQPQVDSNTRKLVGMEALLRWHNPELGEVSPRGFYSTGRRIQSNRHNRRLGTETGLQAEQALARCRATGGTCGGERQRLAV